ncbi:MAG: hypothetical protein IKI95_07965 [Clostridia bacterium]|nr:hypothetical protein [Clostridia bacterium]
MSRNYVTLGKILGWVFLGVLIAAVVLFAVVGIGSIVNGVSISDQIVQWFGTAEEVVNESTAVFKTFLN